MTGDTCAIVTCFLFLTTITLANGQLLSTEHRTNAASERVNDLWCYHCHTSDDGERCSNLTGNYTAFEHKCTGDKRTCMVKRFSFTTSTEDSTSSPLTWSLERNCTSKCEPGCIVIGERTKLSACTTCCEQSLCNVGTGASNDLTMKGIDVFLALLLQITLTIIMYPS
ncbi:uncharacterized protein LOC100883291 [Megachile rotundata]|uniref:uncharacterized protein LOC100883291 n=1 Tax=Megachile rotundata TaxID=143995 RepID=UPI00061528B5|nr:PREDICTED: uncharacterized protein LOC100883291 [Megachile rotundata]XP_012144482.1 PREDICTED: uncharacterized protein LOC100883291 [Megachile rotundata]XP_012144483.1 PREDICTED: uncharacterized protein LOC100883291 [Megachile rotundata]XP_012144484.1 PREDICTED: uncharacterized protein LOC100883291 [Megachile rotundata]